MSFAKKMKRDAKKKARKDARSDYVANRDLGPCYIKGCQNNGDLTDACRFCDFKVQACTEHHPMGQQKARQHVILKHPTKSIPTLMLGVLQGRKA